MTAFCISCINKTCLKTKKPCEEVEKLLPKSQTGRLKGEFFLSTDLIDRDFAQDINGKIINLYDVRKKKDSSFLR